MHSTFRPPTGLFRSGLYCIRTITKVIKINETTSEQTSYRRSYDPKRASTIYYEKNIIQSQFFFMFLKCPISYIYIYVVKHNYIRGQLSMWDWLEKRIFSEKFLLIVWAHYLIFIRIYYSNKEFVINCKFDFLYLVYIEIGEP